jgi:hypothetical protein
MRNSMVGLFLSSVAVVSGCSLGGEDLESDFREAILSGWVSEGVQFFGRYGSGPITAVEPIDENSWTVTFPEEGIGEIQGEFRISEMAAYRIYPTEEFARHLNEKAVEVDRRSGLVREAWLLVSGGNYQAIGRMSIEVSRANSSGVERITVHALLPVVAEGEDASWEVRADARSLLNLFGVIGRFYETMLRSDDRVMDCAAGTDPASDRPLFMSCAEEILSLEFDPAA